MSKESSSLSLAAGNEKKQQGNVFSFRFLQKAKPPVGRHPIAQMPLSLVWSFFPACSSMDTYPVYLRLPTTLMQVTEVIRFALAQAIIKQLAYNDGRQVQW